MSRFFSPKFETLTPYTPGEQPKSGAFVKLNTNESPFPPSPKALEEGRKELERLNLYPDPECTALKQKAADVFGVNADEIIAGNGSDEILNFAFMAFCDKNTPAVFADITYGFYKVFAEVNGVPYREIPLGEDFSLDPSDYAKTKGTVFIANPNAPTGMAIPVQAIEDLLKSDPDRMVVVDEAYVDFGGESCIPLIKKYDNLLVCMTFSKSRSMAGARLGFGIGNRDIIRDLQTLRYSNNPYNVNRVTAAMGYGVLSDEDYTKRNCDEIIGNREYTVRELKRMGFQTLDSKANFLFTKSERIGGETLYEEAKKRGVLIRHFRTGRLREYNRVSIGSREQMDVFLKTVREILEGQ